MRVRASGVYDTYCLSRCVIYSSFTRVCPPAACTTHALLQVRIAPYMAPSQFDAIVADHMRQATVSPLHARLRATLSSVESRGRKRSRRNAMAPGERVRIGDVVRTVQVSTAVHV